MAVILQFWGKAQPDEAATERCHPVVYHLLADDNHGGVTSGNGELPAEQPSDFRLLFTANLSAILVLPGRTSCT